MPDEPKKPDLESDRARHEARIRAGKNFQDTEEGLIRLNLDQQRMEYEAQLAAEQEEREANSRKRPRRLGTLAFMIILGLSIIGDSIEAFSLGTLDWGFGFVIDLILLAVFGFSVKKQFKNMLLVAGAEFIPGLDILPFRTFYILFARYHLKTI